MMEVLGGFILIVVKQNDLGPISIKTGRNLPLIFTLRI